MAKNGAKLLNFLFAFKSCNVEGEKKHIFHTSPFILVLKATLEKPEISAFFDL